MNRTDTGGAGEAMASCAQASTGTWTKAVPAADALIQNLVLGDTPELSVQSELVQEVTVQRLSHPEEQPSLLRPRRARGGRAWVSPQTGTTPHSICPN